MAINLELLRTFVSVATAETFAVAATRRHVTPSAISQQIRALEAQLGVSLFERFGRRARLTEVGRELLGGLRDQLAAIDLSVAAVSERPGRARGTIRIGAPGPFARVWLRPRLIQLLQRHPDLVVEARFDVTSRLVRGLVDGAFDFCVLVDEPAHASLQVVRIFVEEFVAVASEVYLARHGRPRTADEFRQHRYVVFDADQAMHAPWWRAGFGRREPMPTHIVARVASLDEMLALAIAGLGIAVLPNYFVSDSLATGAVVPLAPVGHARASARNPIYLGWRRGAPQTAAFRLTKQLLIAVRADDGRAGLHRSRTQL